MSALRSVHGKSLRHADVAAKGIARIVLERKLHIVRTRKAVGEFHRQLGTVHGRRHAARGRHGVGSAVVTAGKLRKVYHLGFALREGVVRAGHPFQVAFQFRPAIAQAITVRFAKVTALRLRIVPVHIFPPVREPVQIAVVIISPTHARVRLPALDVRRILHVGFAVGNARHATHGALHAVGSVLGLVYHAGIVIVKYRHALAHIAQHILVGGLRALDSRIRGKEGLAVPGFPIQHLPAGKRILATAIIVGAVAGELAARSLENIVVVVICLRALARTFELCTQCIAVQGGGGALLVVIAHEVYLVRTAIGHAAHPVIDNVVKYVKTTRIIAVPVEATAQAPVAARIVCKQVVVEAADIAADGRRVPVPRSRCIVLVIRNVQRFRNQRALQRKVLAASAAEGFVNRPADARMVQYAVVAAGEPHAVVSGTITQAHAHEADDHVLAREPDGGALDGNTLAGSCLPCNRHVILIAD